MKAATYFSNYKPTKKAISIHAAREGGDLLSSVRMYKPCEFQSTPPVKAATYTDTPVDTPAEEFQSTPPVKAATRQDKKLPYRLHGISIHAAREGGDAVIYNLYKTFRISIHAAREGGDQPSRLECAHSYYFNPRRP